jgi:hypothetical protein
VGNTGDATEKYKDNFEQGPLVSGVTSGGQENYMSFYTKNIKASRDKNKPIRWIYTNKV